MKDEELKQKIWKLVKNYVEEYPEKEGVPDVWRTPLVGFADVNDPYIRNLPYVVAEVHKMPEDFMVSPTVVVSYFVPFKKELADTNIGVEDNRASETWARAYKDTNQMLNRLNEYLVEQLQEMGFRAAVPQGVRMLEDILKSNWSQRHIACAAGLGTFGINNMLITREGCCGRYSSIVADLPVEPDHMLAEENCLYKSRGICKKCVDNCFSGALTVDGFDREKCLETCKKNAELYGVTVCGKCDTNIPCAFKAPGK